VTKPSGRTKAIIGADASALPSQALLALTILGLDAVCVRDARELFWQGLKADDSAVLVVLGPQGLPGYDLDDVLDAWSSVGIRARVVQIDEFEVHERALQFLLGGLPTEDPPAAQLRCA
jgi:hypothetical protein